MRLSVLIITCVTALLQWIFLIIVANEITGILKIKIFLTKQTMERRKQKAEVSTEDGAKAGEGDDSKSHLEPLLTS